MGEIPEWYGLIAAAKYLGVAPWELEEQPLAWRRWAEAAMSAEGLAQQHEIDKNNPSAGGVVM